MFADLWANLAVQRPPAPVAQRLRELATWRRRGRLPQNLDRVFSAWAERDGWLYLPRGLVRQAAQVATLRLRDRRFLATPLDFHWHGRLFEYQRAALTQVQRTEGGTLIAPSGGGKTEMGLAFIAAMKQPALWIVTSLDLADQALTRARGLYMLPETAFGLICEQTKEGRRYPVGSHLTVAVIDTLAKYPELARTLGGRVGTVVADECHHLPAASFVDVLRRLPARYRLGLTATADRGDGLGAMIPALTGPVTQVPVSALVRVSRLLLPRVEIVYTGFPGAPTGAGGWDAYQKARARDEARNALAVRLIRGAAASGRRVIAVVDLIEHAEALAALVRAAGVPCSALIGDEDRATRTRLLQAIRNRPGACLVATKLVDEGIDLPEADCLVLVTPGRSALRLRQQVGRVMRVSLGKRSAVVYDMADRGSKALLVQLRERLHTYRHFGDVDLRPLRYTGAAG